MRLARSADELTAKGADAAIAIGAAADIDLANQLSREVFKRTGNHATACIVATNILAWAVTAEGLSEVDGNALLEAVRLLLLAAIKSLQAKEREPTVGISTLGI